MDNNPPEQPSRPKYFAPVFVTGQMGQVESQPILLLSPVVVQES